MPTNDTYAIKFTQLSQNPTYISGAQTGIIKFNETNGSAIIQILNTVAPHIKWELENIGEGISTGKKTIGIKGYVSKTRIDLGEGMFIDKGYRFTVYSDGNGNIRANGDSLSNGQTPDFEVSIFQNKDIEPLFEKILQ